ncbi:unnamed protein product [Closterium sp. NIES-54]
MKTPDWLALLKDIDIFACDWDVIHASMHAMYAASASVEGDCYSCLHRVSRVEDASLGAFDSASTVPVPVTLADPSGGPVVARGATVLPCPAAPSGLLIGLHLPLFAKNLVATFVLQDQWVTVTQPGGKLVAICTDSRTGEHLATFCRRPGSGLYTLTTESALVVESGQVAASVEVVASCSCRLLTHQPLLWHHRLGHPSLPLIRGMHSRLLGGELYFLRVVDDYTRYTTVFPLQSKAEVRSVMIRWICAVRRQLSARFQQDLPVLRLHSNRGGEFSSGLLEELCGTEGIRQTFTLPASPQQNGIAECCIGMVMVVARTSIVHAAAPHFLWPFAVRYAAEQLNLWPCVSHPETSPTQRWTGEVDDALPFRPHSPRTVLLPQVCLRLTRCGTTRGAGSKGAGSGCAECPVGTGGTGATGAGGPASCARTTRAGGAGTPGAAGGATVVGAAAGSLGGGAGRAGAPGSGGAGPGGASAGVHSTGDIGTAGCTRDASTAGGTGGTGTAGGTGGAGPGGASTGGIGVGCAGGTGIGVSGASRQESLSLLQIHEWAVRWGSPGGGAGGTGSGGAVTTRDGCSRGATTQPQPSALCHLLSPPPAATEFPIAGTTPLLFPRTDQSQQQLLPASPLPACAPHRASVPAHVRLVRCPRAPAVLDTHDMTLRPSSVPQRVVLPSPPASSLPHVPDLESNLVHAASLTVTHLLAIVVTDPAFESAAAFALVAELVDFVALCRLDYAATGVPRGRCTPSTLLCPERDPDALDIPTPHTYAEAIIGPYSS